MKFLKVIAEFSLISVKQLSLLFKILIAVSAGLAFIIIFVGASVDRIYYWGLLILLPLMVVSIRIYQKSTLQKLLAQLREDWGKEKEKERNFSEIDSFYRYSTTKSGDSDILIDDQTWSDLNMDDLYSRMDRTLTNPGECILYRILRTPLLSDQILKKRNKVIRLFQTNKEIRENVQLGLLRMGKQKGNGITALICGELPPSTPLKLLFSFLALLAFISIIAVPIVWGSAGIIVVILPLYLVNMLATNKVRGRLLFQLAAIRHLGAMIHLGRKIVATKCPELSDYCAELEKATSATKKIARKTFLLLPEASVSSDIAELLHAHIDIYFLREVRIFYSVLDEIHAHHEELRSLYRLIGELDAMQSAASYREGLPGYAVPDFSDRELLLDIKDARHPLLADAVPNSINIREKGITITGSNMAGKTTFLRTLGVNAILAQTIYTCLAASYTANYFRIFSLISETDSLIEGKSYYLVQAEQLLRMIRSSEKDVLTLCLIDEPLAGTNSLERIVASFEILRYLFDHKALAVVATHDLELAGKLEFGFKSYHFTDMVDQEGLSFDFKLRDGITSTSNAIRLLEYLDYPEDIIKRAMKLEL
ncbi:MutS family DNA mismatch repair protein [Planctomycetota bacterium]